MRGLKTKEKVKRKQTLTFFALLIVLLVLLNSVRKVYSKSQESKKALAKMQQEITDLNSRKDYLDGEIEKLSTPEGIKYEIRKKLNVAAVGENVAIIVERETGTTTKVSTPSSWQKIKDFWSSIFK